MSICVSRLCIPSAFDQVTRSANDSRPCPFPTRRVTDSVVLASADHTKAWGPLTLSQVWKIMESLKEEGLTRSIGVSNFQEKDIKEIEGTWTIPPAINQVSPTARARVKTSTDRAPPLYHPLPQIPAPPLSPQYAPYQSQLVRLARACEALPGSWGR